MMAFVGNALAATAGTGRTLLVLGLVAGIVLPELGLVLRPHLAIMVAGLLFLAALRVKGFVVRGGASRALAFVLLAQLALPVVLAILFQTAGWSHPNASALVLMAAACTISGAPNLVVMCGHEPDDALRNLVTGAALLPLTVVPVLALWPPLAGAWSELLAASLRLLVLIAAAAGLAMLLRRFVDTSLKRARDAIDASSAVLMAVLVVALMSAIPEAWTHDRGAIPLALLLAFGANIGLQLAGWLAWRKAPAEQRVAAAVGLGNRNMALFLAALPLSVTEPLLLFIACFQIPMYLTPTLLRPLYSRDGASGGAA